MDNTEELTHISLCTGYGGIDLGLKRVLPNLRTVALCEVEAYACANLVAKMEAGLMDAAPIWSNLKTFPWGAFSDRVDILSGGYPCQPFSAAGKRLGAEDERHLWPAIADGVRILRPRICFFENVEGHITLGLSTVVSDLEELGYEVSWGIFSAAEVGAPHQRKRVFVMAYRCGEGLEGHRGLLARCSEPRWDAPQSQGQVDGGDSGGDAGGCCDKPDLADSNVQHGHGSLGGGDCATEGVSREHRSQERTGWQSRRADAPSLWPSRPGEPQHWWEPPRVVANTEFIGRRGRSDGDARGLCGEIQIARPCGGSAEPAVVDSEGKRSGGGQELCETHGRQERTLSREPHQSGEILGDAQNERRRRLDDESSETSRWQARGHVDGTNTSEQQEQRKTEPKVGGGIDGAADWLDYGELCVSCDNRTDELRMLGNGVCVPTAAKAFVTLMEELL